MERVEIILTADGNYFDGLFVTAGSIAMHASTEATLSFSIIDGGFPDDSYFCLVNRLSSLHPHVQIQRFKIEDSQFTAFPEWHGNKMAYARFLFPRLLPQVDHAIYCDDDILWLADIVDLWRERNSSLIVQACADPEICSTKEPRWFKEHNFAFEAGNYFCAGVMLMNLKLFREEQIVERVYEFLKIHNDCIFADQSALNAVAWGRVGILNPRWMCFTRITPCRDIKTPIVLHYTSNIPWRDYGWREDLRAARMLWYRQNALVRGVSLWGSYRMFNKPFRILRIWCLYIILRVGLMRRVFIFLMSKVNRKCHADFVLNYFGRINEWVK